MTDADRVLLAALQRIADDTSAAIVRQRVETPTSLLDLHTTVIDVQIRAREALGKAEEAASGQENGGMR